MKGKQITLGQKRTVKQNLANSLSQRVIPKMTCEYCGIIGGSGGMKRWHFDHCKKKSIQ